jgi:hypothetical protein
MPCPQQLRTSAFIAAGVVMFNVVICIPTLFFRVVSSPAALIAGAIYGAATAAIVLWGLWQRRRNVHFLPPDQAAIVQSTALWKPVLAIPVVALFGLIGFAHNATFIAAKLSGVVARQTVTVDSSYKRRTRACYQHEVTEVTWLAQGGDVLCFSEPLRPGTRLVLYGWVTALGIAVEDIKTQPAL